MEEKLKVFLEAKLTEFGLCLAVYVNRMKNSSEATLRPVISQSSEFRKKFSGGSQLLRNAWNSGKYGAWSGPLKLTLKLKTETGFIIS